MSGQRGGFGGVGGGFCSLLYRRGAAPGFEVGSSTQGLPVFEGTVSTGLFQIPLHLPISFCSPAGETEAPAETAFL